MYLYVINDFLTCQKSRDMITFSEVRFKPIKERSIIFIIVITILE